MRGRIIGLLLTLLLAPTATALAAGPPVTVSPGDTATMASVEDACPTFSWGLVEGAEAIELVIYRVDAATEPSEPILKQTFPGSVNGWTVSGDRCLARGGQYAWSVRSVSRAEASDWSEPRLFRLPARPTTKEFEAAMATVVAYLGPNRPQGLNSAPSQEPSDVPPTAHSTRGVVITGSNGTADLAVTGEVRTLDPGGEPRLWGRGRPGTRVYGPFSILGICFTNNLQKYGLSHVAVDWGSAADACPAGTWVCRSDDVVGSSCNTTRLDDENDAIRCDGTERDLLEDAHEGWLADHSTFTTTTPKGIIMREGTGTTNNADTCSTYPVWCCWD